jgi:putative membrane protein
LGKQEDAMQILRTALWVLVAVITSAFVAINWQSVPVNLWPLSASYLYVEWPVGIVALVFFLAGLVPMWLLAKTTRWRLNRRIANLENALKAASPTPPLATSTQFAAMQDTIGH